MLQDTQIVLPFARLRGKTLQADFDGGTVTSDGGVLLLREMESHVGIIRRYVDALDEQRAVRYSPLGAKSGELSLASLSDRELADLLAVSQPAWTAPELGYRR